MRQSLIMFVYSSKKRGATPRFFTLLFMLHKYSEKYWLVWFVTDSKTFWNENAFMFLYMVQILLNIEEEKNKLNFIS